MPNSADDLEESPGSAEVGGGDGVSRVGELQGRRFGEVEGISGHEARSVSPVLELANCLGHAQLVGVGLGLQPVFAEGRDVATIGQQCDVEDGAAKVLVVSLECQDLEEVVGLVQEVVRGHGVGTVEARGQEGVVLPVVVDQYLRGGGVI